jgi:hypothetical protein
MVFVGSSLSNGMTLASVITILLLILGVVLAQATVGPCNVPKPRAWNPVEQSKWTRLVPPHSSPAQTCHGTNRLLFSSGYINNAWKQGRYNF